jgi:16S rRNA (uracil1498-N3)-methyltransferase
MHRFIAAPENIRDGLITLKDENLKHLRQVLRLETGSVIRVFDGNGTEYEAELLDVNKNAAIAKVLLSFRSETEPKIRVTLFQGLPKGEKMELIIQKAVELGIYRIVPVITQRTVVQLDKKEREKKAERWTRIAGEAAKQCRRATIPEVAAPVDFDDAITWSGNYGASLLLYENEEKKCLKELLKCYTINKIKDIALFIGSEGGFSEQEVEKCIALGYNIAGLGKRILRAETAAISVLAIIMYEMGELQ